MEQTTIELLNEEITISSKQKGDIIENRTSEMITLSSKGKLTCYTPNSDDDGIDLIVNPRNEFKPLFIQIKSRFVLQKSGQFIQNVGMKTFSANKMFYLLFVYFNQSTLEVDRIWLIPSLDFESLAIKVKEGERFKPFYRFSAGMANSKDKWSSYAIDKSEVGSKLQDIIYELYQSEGAGVSNIKDPELS